MIFSRDLFPLVIAGGKTETRRPKHGPGDHCPIGIRGEIAVQPGRGKYHRAHAVDVLVRHERLDAITEEDARREGFASVAAFLDAWHAIYGDAAGATWVCVVEWRAVEVRDCCHQGEEIAGVAA